MPLPRPVRPDAIEIHDTFDVAVQSQISGFDIGLLRSDSEVDLVAAYREIILVQPEAVGEVDEAAIADAGSSDDIGQPVGQPCSLREYAGPVCKAVALSNGACDRQLGPVERSIAILPRSSDQSSP